MLRKTELTPLRGKKDDQRRGRYLATAVQKVSTR